MKIINPWQQNKNFLHKRQLPSSHWSLRQMLMLPQLTYWLSEISYQKRKKQVPYPKAIKTDHGAPRSMEKAQCMTKSQWLKRNIQELQWLSCLARTRGHQKSWQQKEHLDAFSVIPLLLPWCQKQALASCMVKNNRMETCTLLEGLSDISCPGCSPVTSNAIGVAWVDAAL